MKLKRFKGYIYYFKINLSKDAPVQKTHITCYWAGTELYLKTNYFKREGRWKCLILKLARDILVRAKRK